MDLALELYYKLNNMKHHIFIVKHELIHKVYYFITSQSLLRLYQKALKVTFIQIKAERAGLCKRK